MIDKKYKFKKQLEYLDTRNNNSGTLISLYIPWGKYREEVINHLQREIGYLKRIDTPNARYIEKTLDSLIEWIDHIQIPQKGICFFTGIRSNEDHTIETIIVKPPYKIESYMYMCDEFYNTSKLKGMKNKERIHE